MGFRRLGLPENEKLKSNVCVSVTSDERVLIRAIAKELGVSPSAFVREIVLKHIEERKVSQPSQDAL